MSAHVKKKLADYRQRLLGTRIDRKNTLRLLRDVRDELVTQNVHQFCRDHPNPLNRFGLKCFSQTDEDGITLEILRRINGLGPGAFAEIGVGNGTENNTLILKALGWKGFWIGGEQLAFDTSSTPGRFAFFRSWVTLDNLLDLTSSGKSAIGITELDVVSIDLDGNDLHFVKALLESDYRPKLFIVEYNAKFPPPVEWVMEYRADHTWAGDDYFGASLASFVSLFSRHGFRLVCCNGHSGANAFFVREDFNKSFADVPDALEEIYVPPRYLPLERFGHPSSIKTIASLFNEAPAAERAFPRPSQ